MTNYELDLKKYPGMAEMTLSDWIRYALELGFSGDFTIEVKMDLVIIKQGLYDTTRSS
jgi:hypothetical protein